MSTKGACHSSASGSTEQTTTRDPSVLPGRGCNFSRAGWPWNRQDGETFSGQLFGIIFGEIKWESDSVLFIPPAPSSSSHSSRMTVRFNSISLVLLRLEYRLPVPRGFIKIEDYLLKERKRSGIESHFGDLLQMQFIPEMTRELGLDSFGLLLAVFRTAFQPARQPVSSFQIIKWPGIWLRDYKCRPNWIGLEGF